jgi:hypothetical protein
MLTHLPQVVSPGTIVWTQRALERLEAGVGPLVELEPEPTVEPLAAARLRAHVTQILNTTNNQLSGNVPTVNCFEVIFYDWNPVPVRPKLM